MKGVLIVALASGLSGALVTLALPPANHWWLGWFALVPLLISVRGRGFLWGFFGGLAALFSMAILADSGFVYSEQSRVGNSAWLYTGCGLFGFSVSILSGCWADRGAKRKPLWWFATLAVLLEAALLIQLPAHLALSQYRNPLMLFFASIGGIWLVSFFIWYFNMLVADLARNLGWKQITWLGVLFLGIVVGNFTWKLFPADLNESQVFGILQTSETDPDSLKRLHNRAIGLGAYVVVWPEFAGLGMARDGNTSELRDMAAESRSAIVTSYNDNFQPMPHNVAAVITADGESDLYFKRKLFGGEAKMHTPGERAIQAGHIGLNICFDTCYPYIIRETALLPGVSVVVLPTIDPESPHHFIAALHGAFTPFRAAENGVSIVRADGFAHSMIVGSNGRILSNLAPGEDVSAAAVTYPKVTLYRQLGDWFAYLCGLGFAIGVIRYRSVPSI